MYYVNRNQKGFLKGTTLNGEDVAGREVSELKEEYQAWMEGLTVELTEKEKPALSGSLADMGFSFDSERFANYLAQEENEEKTNPIYMLQSLTMGYPMTIQDVFKEDRDSFRSFVASESFAEERVESRDASLQLDKKKDLYVLEKPIQGNMIDDEKLRRFVRTSVIEALNEHTLPDGGTLTLAVPEDVYTSKKVSMDTSELESQLPEKNKELRRSELEEMSITYTFGAQTQVLDGKTISSWVEIDDKLKLKVDDESVKAYVEELAAKYNTRYLNRTFTTTYGSQITIDASRNEYGYTINNEEEAKQLKAAIEARKSETREPVYVTVNSYGNPYFLSRNGTDDLNGTYVEVNLSAQHLWFYSGGKLVVESDLVSGNTSNGTGTATGCFPLAFKKSPATLTGQNAEDAWSSDVDYWMPFFMGQGLHDAPWRGSFGGTIYKYDGSHGCVNLPYNAARTIYNNITPGTAIIIFY